MPRPGVDTQQIERLAQSRQKLRDAARLLPVFGAAVLLLPDLLLSDSDVARGATAPWTVYFFLAWLGLIVLAWILSRKLRRDTLAEEAGAAAGLQPGAFDARGPAPGALRPRPEPTQDGDHGL